MLLFKKFNIPSNYIEPIMNYTDTIDCFIYYFLFHFKEDKNSFQKLKDWLLEIYEKHYIFTNDSIYQLLIILSYLSKISYTLFANLSYYFKLSHYAVREEFIKQGVSRESEGYYYLAPFFREFLKNKGISFFK
ncbi:hypothetical protein AZF37_06700 [endosymbiont 'TC1' of Trimyema compressum]|nr:hypothetical protein AZF37_06700 [endosymbiont 'TC1' of Trimyema compressum]